MIQSAWNGIRHHGGEYLYRVAADCLRMAGIDDALDGACPKCGEEPTDAHVRGTEIVLVPCGHVVSGPSSLEVPPEERRE